MTFRQDDVLELHCSSASGAEGECRARTVVPELGGLPFSVSRQGGVVLGGVDPSHTNAELSENTQKFTGRLYF